MLLVLVFCLLMSLGIMAFIATVGAVSLGAMVWIFGMNFNDAICPSLLFVAPLALVVVLIIMFMSVAFGGEGGGVDFDRPNHPVL